MQTECLNVIAVSAVQLGNPDFGTFYCSPMFLLLVAFYLPQRLPIQLL